MVRKLLHVQNTHTQIYVFWDINSKHASTTRDSISFTSHMIINLTMERMIYLFTTLLKLIYIVQQ